MSLPNFITICRLLLVPAVVHLIVVGEYAIAFWLFAAAGVSDAVDGFIAKTFKSETELGRYLDPLADKALLVSIYVALGVQAELPVWLVFLAVSRDIFIIAAVLLSWILGRPVRMAPLMISKANTAGQILLAVIILADLGFGLAMTAVRTGLVVLVAGLTIVSALAYLVGWLKHMANSAGAGDTDDGEPRNEGRA